MRYKLFLLLTLLFIGLALNAQKEKYAFKLQLEAPQFKDSTVYILSYWDGQTYIQDSCRLSNKGLGIFQTEKPYPTGQYALYIKPDIQIELLLDKEQDNIKITLAKEISKSKISGNKDTEILWSYIQYMNAYIEKQTAIFNEDNINISQSEEDKLRKKSGELEKQLEVYNQKLIDDNKGRWASDFLTGMIPITLPIQIPNSDDDIRANRKYMQDHYFDNISLSDPRFLYTDYLQQKIDDYMNNYIDQEADSLAFAASRMVAMAKGNQLCFDHMLMRHLNGAMASKRMGMENTWAKLAEDYIFDKNFTKIDSAEVSKLRMKYELIKHNRIGMTAHDLRLEQMNGDTLFLHDIDAEYTIIYFFDPGCSHCKTKATRIHKELYPKYKDRGLKVVTFNIVSEMNSWAKFIENCNISDWINCADPQYKSEYWKYYDTSGVPVVYVLDKDKKIIAKNIDEDGLEMILKYLYKEDGTN